MDSIRHKALAILNTHWKYLKSQALSSDRPAAAFAS